MKSNLNRPIWPYMVILSILFTASMRAPRAWQRVASDESLAPKSATPRRDAAVRLASTALQPSIDARIPTISATTVVPAVAVQENPVATGDDELEELQRVQRQGGALRLFGVGAEQDAVDVEEDDGAHLLGTARRLPPCPGEGAGDTAHTIATRRHDGICISRRIKHAVQIACGLRLDKFYSAIAFA